jgi:16S rRNA processing protein RimM
MNPGHAERPAGSPAAGEPAFLAVGKVRRPHGVSGDVLVEIYTDFPERLRPNAIVYAGETHLPLTISRQRFHNDGTLLAFDGFSTPEQVGRFRNHVLYIKKAEAEELPEGEYYFHQLLGLSVIDETGEPLGEVTEIMETGANDVYVVTNDAGRELLLPAIAEVILSVDMDSKTMQVHLLPGLLDNGDLD